MHSKKIRLHNRLDIIVKLLYIEAYENKENYQYCKYLYEKHIKFQNAFLENGKKNKNDFLESFHKLIKSFKKEWFVKNHPITVWLEGTLIDGAHRYACCIYFNKKINICESKDKGINWWIEWFIKNNFSRKDILYILKKYKEISWDTLIILWPTCDINKIKRFYNIAYKISFQREEEIWECISDIYGYELYLEKDIGIQKKVEIVKKYKYFNIILLPKFEKKLLRKELEKHIHSKYIAKKEKPFFTFHSWDNKEEEKYIEDIILSYNYYKHLSWRENNISTKLQKFLKELQPIYTRNMCIVWSAPMWLYNLVTVSDIDIIEKDIQNKWIIKISNNTELLDYQYYKKISHKDIITNPENFFYYRWFKCISLEILLRVKENGHREKDQKQANILKNFLDKTKQIKQKKNYVKTLSSYIKFFYIRFLINLIEIVRIITKKIWIYEKTSQLWRTYILKRYR